MDRIDELNNNIIREIKNILGSRKIMDAHTFNSVISGFLWISTNYNSRYIKDDYNLWHNGEDFLRFDLFEYLGKQLSLFSLAENGDNLTLMFKGEPILAVRNVISDRFSNAFMISYAEKSGIDNVKLDFLVTKNFIFGFNETFQNAGSNNFITLVDYLESGQKEKIDAFKYVYCKNDYGHNSIIVDRFEGVYSELNNKGDRLILKFDPTNFDDAKTDEAVKAKLKVLYKDPQ